LSMQNETFIFLNQTGFINYFVFEELDKQREAYDNLTQEDFIKDFIITDDVVQDFQDYLRERLSRKITFLTFKTEIKLYIKAALGEQLFGNGTYEKVINHQDIMIEEVIKLSAAN